MPKYSIVVPFHNEEENVTALYDRLKAVMEQIGDSFELVLVDDGSSDRTYKLLEEIAAVDSRVLVVKLRRKASEGSDLDDPNPIINSGLTAIIVAERYLPVKSLPGVTLFLRARRP